jgi:ABC-type sugar transport system ATPase subunit
MKSIRFENVEKYFAKNKVISGLNLSILSGERIILLGPSGCGKTTTLRMISGLENITAGNLYMGGRKVNDVESGDRNVAMVFQNYALFPHLTVFKNIAFGLRTHKLPKAEIKKRVEEIMGVLELGGLEDRLPRQLSGGQRQRVALSRAAIKKADFFLLDEPLSNLDAQLRVQARKELVKLHEMYHPTFVYVTHDQTEAMAIGHRIVLMHKGSVQMNDTPYELYYHPANVFTAKFIGSPPMNILEGQLTERSICLGQHKTDLSEAWLKTLGNQRNNKIKMGIRPENVSLSEDSSATAIPVYIKYVENYGNKLGAYFDVAGTECIALEEQNCGIYPGKLLYWKIALDKLSFFDSQTEKNIGYPKNHIHSKKEDSLEDFLDNGYELSRIPEILAV